MLKENCYIGFLEVMIIAFAFLLFTGCSDMNNRNILAEANLVLESNPDSSLILLSKIQYPILLKSKDKADYWRIRSYAHSKQGAAMVTDSLILFSLDYYKAHKEMQNMLESYLLAGEYYEWIGLADSVISITTQGLSESEKLNDSVYISKFLLLQGSIEYKRRNFKEAVELHKQMLRIDNNHYSYYIIGLLQNRISSEDDYRPYINRSIEQALAKGDSMSAAHYIRNYASILLTRKDYTDAIKLIKYSGEISEFYKDFGANHLTMADIYIQLNQLDSAQVYLDKACTEKLKDSSGNYTNTNLLGYENAILALQAILDTKKNKVVDLTPMFQYNDWVIAENNNKNAILNKQLSDRYSLEKQNLELIIERQKMQFFFILSSFILFMASIVLYLFYMKKKRKVREIEERTETLQRLFRDALRVKDEKENNSLLFRNTLLQQLGIIRLIATSSTNKKDLLQKIVNISNEEISTESLLKWNDLFPIIDSVYDNFHKRLCLKYGSLLNEKELQLCCLLCADFSTAEISAVMQQSMQTIYQRKTTIRTKIKTDEKEDIINFLKKQI